MPQGPFEPAEAATDIGADQDDLSLPVLEVIKTFLLAIVIVGTLALLISSSK